MAQLKDLIVNGASRLIGDAYTNKIQINSISAYSNSGKTTYGLGSSGQILKSDGTNIYWANDNNSGGTVTSVRVQASSPLQSSSSAAQSASLNTTISFQNQNANTILAGPSSGSAAAPNFRALVPEDIPGLSSTAIGSTKIPIYWDGDSFEQANGIFENLSYDYETDSSKNTLKIKVNNEQKTCELLMKELKIGDKTYQGNQAVEIGITDLGLTKAMTFKGVTEETDLAVYPTKSPVSIIGGSSLTPTDGDVVLYKPNSQEFVWSNGEWHLLGLASSFALQNHIHGNISNDGKLKINNAIVANKSVITNSTGDITAKEQHFIFKGTCATAAATAKKVVTCPDFTSTDLIAGAAIAVIFNITNTAAIDNLVLKVNTTDEKPIRYIRNNTISKIPSAGYLAANQTYLFHYDGTYWIIDNMLYDANTNTLLRTYASSSTNELPLVGVSTNTSMAVPTHTSSYKDLYGGIPSVVANRPTLNLSTGFITSNLLAKTLKGTSGTTYGATLPASAQVGQIFFKEGNTADSIIVSASTSKAYVLGTLSSTDNSIAPVFNTSVYTEGTVLYGAAWNDYAEMRECYDTIKPGQCVYEVGNDSMKITTQRLQRGCKIVSDTFGFNIGETKKAKTPIAVAGRVLAYCYEGKEIAKDYIGWPVCSGPNGTVSIMTEEEEVKYPSRIIGIISSIPDYEYWGEKHIKVDGRIWIYVK